MNEEKINKKICGCRECENKRRWRRLQTIYTPSSRQIYYSD